MSIASKEARETNYFLRSKRFRVNKKGGFSF